MRKMWDAAKKFNTGRPRSKEVKDKISATYVANKKKSGDPFCDIVNRPMYVKDGHWYVFVNGRKVMRAKAIYELVHGRIPSGFIIHHIDGDGFNDDIKNLMVMSRRDHTRLHELWNIISLWAGEKISGKQALAFFKEYRKARK